MENNQVTQTMRGPECPACKKMVPFVVTISNIQLMMNVEALEGVALSGTITGAVIEHVCDGADDFDSMMAKLPPLEEKEKVQ